MTAEEYLRRVDLWLRDLPWKVRRQLIAELRGHLDELPAGTDLLEQLGTTKQYAADLRAAAGLERRHGLVAFLRARRPRNVVLTAVVLTVIGLAIGAVAWVDSYQPLVFDGGLSQFPPAPWKYPGAAARRSSSARADFSSSASRSTTPADSPFGCSARVTSHCRFPSRPG